MKNTQVKTNSNVFKNKTKSLLIVVTVVLLSLILTSCSSGSTGFNSSNTVPPVKTTPQKIFPIPANTISLSPPMYNGQVWTLSGSASAKAMSRYSLSTGKFSTVVPVSRYSAAITSDGISQVVVGVSGPANVGSLNFFNGLSGVATGSIPLPDPVRAMSTISPTGLLVILMQTTTTESVALVDVINRTIEKTIPVSTGTIAVSVGRDPSTFFALENNDSIDSISTATGQLESIIELRQPGINLTLSKTENVLLILKCTSLVCNIALMDTATDQIFNTIPAPLNCIDVVIAPTDDIVYDLVNSPKASNVQIYNIGKYMPVFG